MTNESLSFITLEERIHEIPDGPATTLNTPRWMLAFSVIGVCGMVMGLLPSLFIRFFDPQLWMLTMARAGVWAAYLGFAPEALRTIFVVVRGMWFWRAEQVQQLDHDLAEFRALNRWLVEFPKAHLEVHVHFARMVQTRLASKIGLLVGSLDKLGVLPIVIVLGIQLKGYDDPTAIPMWQIFVGLFLVITYLIAWVGAHMRLRVQLYEALLIEALQKKGG